MASPETAPDLATIPDTLRDIRRTLMDALQQCRRQSFVGHPVSLAMTGSLDATMSFDDLCTILDQLEQPRS